MSKRDPVTKALARAEAALARNRERVASISAVTDDEHEARIMARDYVEGDSTSAIAKRFGVTPQTVTNRLRALGIALRPTTFREPAFYRDKATRLRMQADALETVATIVQGCEVPPAELLARTTGGG
jgi:transposase-like protein